MKLSQKDVLIFLRSAYFGNYEDTYIAASYRAYRDFCRTIRSREFNDATNEIKGRIKDQVTSYLKSQIQELRNMPSLDQATFDAWHHNVCLGIIERFPLTPLFYGQAQKWLNMMFKYLCVLDESLWEDTCFNYLHVPFDNIIIDIAVNSGFIERPVMRWSRWREQEYNQYQTNLRAAIHENKGKNYPPLLWEFRNWKADE